MALEVLDQDLGSEGKLSIKFEGGKVKLSLSHDHSSGKVAVSAEEDASYFLDKLKAAIPGGIDDAVIEVLKAAIKVL